MASDSDVILNLLVKLSAAEDKIEVPKELKEYAEGVKSIFSDLTKLAGKSVGDLLEYLENGHEKLTERTAALGERNPALIVKHEDFIREIYATLKAYKEKINEEGLTIPHPRIQEREFVLQGLRELGKA